MSLILEVSRHKRLPFNGNKNWTLKIGLHPRLTNLHMAGILKGYLQPFEETELVRMSKFFMAKLIGGPQNLGVVGLTSSKSSKNKQKMHILNIKSEDS